MNDQRIDALLAARPLKAPDDFGPRVLAATEAVDSARRIRPRRHRWAVALPAAAAIALMLTLVPRAPDSLVAPAATGNDLSQTDPALQEALLLDRGLSGLDAIQTDPEALDVDGILATFDALYLDLQS